MPTGQYGGQPNIPFLSQNPNSLQHISLSNYLKFHLHPHPPKIETDHFFCTSLLFQELVVHLCAAAEHSCLMWVKDNQKQLHTDLYNGVVDALHEGIDLTSIGKKVILLTSFTSGPQFMQ
jgi:Helitron helicase-like domain at N-terminus